MHNVLLRRFGDFGIWDYGATATPLELANYWWRLGPAQLLEQLPQTINLIMVQLLVRQITYNLS